MPDLAVVPIFVNATAAVLPAIIAGAASAVALLFRPRELISVFRRRPWIPAVLTVFVGLGVHWMIAAKAVAPQPARVQQPTNWAEVGRQIVRARQYAGQGATRPTTTAAVTDLMLGVTPQRTGYDGGPVPLRLSLEPLWSHAEPETFYLSTPIVRDGRVYGASCQLDLVGKYGYVFAADARTGKILWKTSSATKDGTPFNAFFSSPAISKDGKSLVIGQGLHEHADCSLLCLDTETGTVRWQVPTTLHLESSPAIRGDLVVIGAGAIEDANHKPTTDPGFVLAVSLASGKELWRYPIADPESSPAIDEAGVVYIGSGFNGNATIALKSNSDADLKSRGDDRLIWRVPAPYPIVGPVTLAGDLAIVGGGNSDFVNADPRPAGVVMAIDRKTGSVRWRRDMADAVLGSVSFLDGKVFCPIRNGFVVVLDAADGKDVWRAKVGEGSPILAGLAVTANRLYVVNKIGQLHVLNPADGTPAEPPRSVNGKPGDLGFCLSGPTVAEGRLYIGSETGGLRCFVGTK
ncbi:outer membrane protein assembly factor BamB family protein [Humisphaera borealis]|uniref:PQQ-binding-like beta-propeller repeat protein n=1 Tax=Humisphaera borealis TaxID=2807512 RepID=A0A7M2X1V3_9BACT|nr:PQQ-binding-like beta-propeller repeat protein [Humisphaera borealis]QOV91655.1 PQQ-binding-like beta-propeller repeat protein [Humisphaera borealis]